MGTRAPVTMGGSKFVANVQSLGGSERDGKRLWARMVSCVRGATYTPEGACTERLHGAELTAIVDRGPIQFQNLKEGDWRLIIEATKKVVV